MVLAMFYTKFTKREQRRKEAKMQDPLEIGRKLAKLRGSRTQAEVAKAVGISESAYSMYEQGKRVPRDAVKIRLADYYKQPVHKIFF